MIQMSPEPDLGDCCRLRPDFPSEISANYQESPGGWQPQSFPRYEAFSLTGEAVNLQVVAVHRGRKSLTGGALQIPLPTARRALGEGRGGGPNPSPSPAAGRRRRPRGAPAAVAQRPENTSISAQPTRRPEPAGGGPARTHRRARIGRPLDRRRTRSPVRPGIEVSRLEPVAACAIDPPGRLQERVQGAGSG